MRDDGVLLLHLRQLPPVHVWNQLLRGEWNVFSREADLVPVPGRMRMSERGRPLPGHMPRADRSRSHMPGSPDELCGSI